MLEKASKSGGGYKLPGISRPFQVMVMVNVPTSTGQYVTLRLPSCSRSMLQRHTVFGPSTQTVHQQARHPSALQSPLSQYHHHRARLTKSTETHS